MPDGFALAALDAAMRFRIDQFLRRFDATGGGAVEVVTRAPEQLSGKPPNTVTITVYPWRFDPNPSWQSTRDPAYSASGERQENPWLALDVKYLVCGYGPDPDVDSALGIAMLALHETPRLSPEILQAAAGGTFDPGSPLPGALRDLIDQPAPLTVTPMPMTTETLSQLWSMMNAGLRPGMAYDVSTLMMEYRAPKGAAPPVAEPRLGVALLRRPHIASLRFSAGPPSEPRWRDQPVAEPGDRLRVTGSGLRGDITQLVIGTAVITPDVVSPDRVESTVPANQRPGVVTIQVRHRWPKPAGEGPPAAGGTIPAEGSNPVPAAIRPLLGTPAVALDDREEEDGHVTYTATVTFAVAVGRAQQAELLLTARAADASGRFPSVTVQSPTPAGTVDAAVMTRTFTITDVPPGEYLVRVRVDGAESALDSDAEGYSGPILAVPA